ncbi:MAG: hypothetical protein IPJ60_18950 [Sphingobacteriaceae bacterium]|nr:hypothetical protein [Sphingobacteriaceae bacterium]
MQLSIAIHISVQNDNGFANFNSQDVFSIATCCNVNTIKRLELVSEILKHSEQMIKWHLIGDGPELSK